MLSPEARLVQMCFPPRQGDLSLAITITRRLARQVRAVMRRAFGNIRGHGLAMCFTAAADTLTVRAKFADVTVEYRAPGE